MRRKTTRQLSVILLVAMSFALFNFSIYHIFTKRCLNSYGADMQAKSVELDEYLPFEKDSKVVKVNALLELFGELPVIDGAAALYPVMSGIVQAAYPTASVSFDGTDFTETSRLQMNNTRGAYKNIVDGKSDLILCASPSAEQLTYAQKKGVELEFVPIGKDAFVFVVSRENPIESLTAEQIRGIYTGTYTRWSDVGGDNERIASLTRNEGSGSQTAMLRFMGKKKIKKYRNTFLGHAIGFSFRYYVSDIVKDGTLKLIAVNGIAPGAENIRSGTYPLVSEFFAVYRKGEQNPNVQKIVSWLLSEEGQDMIEKTGYIGVREKDKQKESREEREEE